MSRVHPGANSRDRNRSGDESLAGRGSRWFGLGVGFMLFDFDRAIFQQREDGADRGEKGSQQGADDAGGDRKFGDCSALVLHDNATNIALMNQRLQSLDDGLGIAFEVFPNGLVGHGMSPLNNCCSNLVATVPGAAWRLAGVRQREEIL